MSILQYICGEPVTIGFDIKFPNTGDCKITPSPPQPSPTTSITPNSPPGPSCSRCGGGFSGGISLPDICSLGSGSRRMMAETGIIPSHVIPAHRALINGCQECSASNLKLAFREVDIRQSELQEFETLLTSCMDSDQSLKSMFPCIMRKSWEVIDLMPMLSGVIECQLNREGCYGSADLMNSPGLANLFIQTRRFSSLVRLVLLPFGGAILGDRPEDDSLFNSTMVAQFSDALVLALADSSSGGEFITNEELESLQLSVSNRTHLPRESDIALFADTWNRSLTLWEDGIYSANELPTNFSGFFFDLNEMEDLKSSFLSAKSSIMIEGFAGFGDAWLTAVEGQQLEEAKQLAGVCASVKVQIKQELTLTRIGFEANLEIWNDGDYPLENVTGEYGICFFFQP